MRVLGHQHVVDLLPMSECIDVMADALQAASAAAVSMPPRQIGKLIDGSGFLVLMPGSTLVPSMYGAKVVSLHPANPSAGLPAIQGFVTLFEHGSGTPIAIVEGAAITAIRTAAASGLATRLLVRVNAESHGVLGTGVQARTHIEAIACVRPIERVVVWGRDFNNAKRIAETCSGHNGLRIEATRDPAIASACDVVGVVTGAAEPILCGDWIRKGAHINLVGAHTATTREADSKTMMKGKIFVDLMASAMSEAGDILIPINEGVLCEGSIVGEIGQVISGHIPGRSSGVDVAVYKSLGIVAQDLFAAAHAYTAANARGIGTVVPMT